MPKRRTGRARPTASAEAIARLIAERERMVAAILAAVGYRKPAGNGDFMPGGTSAGKRARIGKKR